jgi:diguanylate cyclase (GGDEF)-like protein
MSGLMLGTVAGSQPTCQQNAAGTLMDEKTPPHSDLAQRLAVAEAELMRLRQVLDALTTGIVLYDAEDRFVFANAEFRRLYALITPHMQPGRSFEELMRQAIAEGLVPAAKGQEEAWLAARLHEHQNPLHAMTRRMADGRWRHIVEQRMADGSHLAHSVDITELVHKEQALQKLNAELAEQSETDALTGVANRRRFDRALAEESNRAQRHGIALSLLLLDIDHFKAYNDRLGHPAGDRCLRQVADTVRTLGQRSSDLLARFGGEEFVLLLPHMAASEAEQHAHRLRTALANAALPHPASPVAGVVTVSIGIAEHRPGDDGATLLARADAAMYVAKNSGRNRLSLAT